MTYTATVETARGFAPAPASQAPAKRRRNAWRRAFARLLVARRRAVEREIAEFACLSGLELPESARRLRRIVQSRATR
jgi:hypothetical protein